MLSFCVLPCWFVEQVKHSLTIIVKRCLILLFAGKAGLYFGWWFPEKRVGGALIGGLIPD